MQRRDRYWGGLVAASAGRAGHGTILSIRPTSRELRRRSSTDCAALVLSLVCSAFLLAAAVGTRSHPWVGWVGLLPLFLVIRSLSPTRAMFCGGLWGFCLQVFFLFGSGNLVPLSVESLILLIGLPAIYTFAGAHLTRRVGFRPLSLAFGWVGLEFALRPLGLDYGLLAGSQNSTGILQIIGLPLGYFFVVFLIALVNAKLLSIAGAIRFQAGRSRLQIRLDNVRGWLAWQVSLAGSALPNRQPWPRGPPFL